jgi:nucleotide-binding universal stress UspA family protein
MPGSYVKAVNDFREARRKASIQGVMARLSGQSTELLSYEEVRRKLRALEVSSSKLRDIPLDAIVGSVGRYTDFTRNFLPLTDSDQDRWARVMSEAIGLTGLPPIEVYQIGEVYFVLDGNHRVSVARQNDASTIQAYVTEVRTRVNITPDTQPDDLIIKAEQTNFLELTELDRLRPESDFTTTNPGQHPILLEHIEVHRYFMGIDDNREVSYKEAVVHWYDEIYLPIIQIIRERGILRHFPERTETDLYLWISRHRADLEECLGWHIETEAAATDLEIRFSSEFSNAFSRLTARIYDALTPDALESGPPPGAWREEALQRRQEHNLLANILVSVSDLDTEWLALEQGLVIASRESGQIQGLHVVKSSGDIETAEVEDLITEFKNRCQAAGIHGHLAIESGAIARIICERSHWTDLIITKVTYPPDDRPIARFGSGLRTMIRRCPRPILAVPNQVSELNHALLAYNGTPKANEALYLATYLASKWRIQLSVLIIEHENIDSETIYDHAREYIGKHEIQANFIHHEPGKRSDIIMKTAQDLACDFILMGGYKSSPVVEVVLGSVVDEVLRRSQIPLLICR